MTTLIRHIGFGRRSLARLLVVASVAVIAAGCGFGFGEDRPGSVSVDPRSETVSVSGTGTGSGTGSGTGTATGTGETGPFGGYEPVSNIESHAKVSLDIVDINAFLDEETINFGAVQEIYEDGKNSESGDSFRTLAGFARGERDEPLWNMYTDHFGDEQWLDTFVTHALEGTGPFEGESDAVRRQGVQKGIQNQVMIAWMLHELDVALERGEAGELDPQSGAPHNWDEAWAFYHGEDPAGAPYATANSRGENFGRGDAVNDDIRREMNRGLQALLDNDMEDLRSAYEEILEQIRVTYVQASIRYANNMAEELEADNEASARVQQAEGWAFFRVIEPMVAEADAEVADTVAGYLDLANEPSVEAREAVRTALESVYADLGITAEQVGELQG